MNLYYRYCNGERNFSETEWLQIVKRNGYAIRHIENPSEEIQLKAVKQNGCAIRFIESSSELVQLEAVKQNGLAILFIKQPSEAVQLEAVKTLNYLPKNITSRKTIEKWHQIQQMKKACL